MRRCLARLIAAACRLMLRVNLFFLCARISWRLIVWIVSAAIVLFISYVLALRGKIVFGLGWGWIWHCLFTSAQNEEPRGRNRAGITYFFLAASCCSAVRTFGSGPLPSSSCFSICSPLAA